MFLLLAIALLHEQPELPAPFLIVDTTMRPARSSPEYHLRIWLHPQNSVMGPGEDIPSFYGLLVFEVHRWGHRARLTRLDEVQKNGTFKALDRSFTPDFQDLNHDGRLDFTLCERSGGYVSDCRIFTIQPNGSVSLLPVVDPDRFVGDVPHFTVEELGPSSQLPKPNGNGFCHPVHWPADGIQCYRWHEEKRHFRQLPVDANGQGQRHRPDG